MKKLNTHSLILFFALVCITHVSINIFSMKQDYPYQSYLESKNHLKKTKEILRLIPDDVYGIIATNLLNLHLNALGDAYEKVKKSDDSTYKRNLFCMHFYKIIRLFPFFHKIRHSINADIIDQQGNTFLHYTMRTIKWEKNFFHPNQLDTYNYPKYLLQYYNVNPNIQNNKGKTAFWHCMDKHLPQINVIYMDQHVKISKNLIQAFSNPKSDPMISSRDGDILHLLAKKEHAESRQILDCIDIKKFMNNKNKDGNTPSCIAAKCLNLEFLQVLSEAGADFNITDAKGCLPLTHAKKQEHPFISYQRQNAVINLLQDKTNTNQ